MNKLLVTIFFYLLLSTNIYSSENNLLPLTKLNVNNNENYSEILARCSAIQVTELSLDDPNANKKFDDMGLFIKENTKFIKFVIPGKSETEDAHNAIAFHEHFVGEYQKIINKHLISNDRSFCVKIKKKIK
ncbi:MAG: hypothetical protein H8E55_09775 [Pelagibacterales bacterium]|jgi:hypothetical protein|nr:hypothetical protein [Pelagibacterales bacterium]